MDETNDLESQPSSTRHPGIDHVLTSESLKSLAHPLRVRIYDELSSYGPMTASGLAERLGESSGSTSYHLRQLAAYGFVEEVEGQGTARERWWRARHRLTSWRADEIEAQEGGAEVEDELARIQLDVRGRVFRAWRQQRQELGPAWTAAASLNDHALRLRPDQARALADELNAVLARWMREHPSDVPADGTELVAVFTDLLPLTEWPS